MYTVIGFHTCEDRGESDAEIKSKVPIKSKPTGQWFGEGYYFWTDSSRYAKSWGTYKKRFISEFSIQFNEQNEIFDLVGNAAHQEEFDDYLKMFIEINQKIKNLDLSRVFCFLRKEAAFLFEQYKAIKGCHCSSSYNYPFLPGRNERILLPTRIQLCLFEKHEGLELKNIVRHQ